MDDKMKNPTSLRYICKLMQKIGYVNFHQNRGTRKDKVQQVFCYVQHCSLLGLLAAHFFSTVTRSIRYLPEFFQNLYEDAVFLKNILGVQMLFRGYSEFKAINDLMEKSFSQSDPKVTRACRKKADVLFFGYASLCVCVLLSNWLEMHLPLSEEDLETRRFVYRTAHPERRHLANLKIPFIDDSKSWSFEAIYIWEICLNFMLVPSLATVVTLLPIIVTHIEGQYEILSRFVEKLGQEHVDSEGNPIYYQSIESVETTLRFDIPIMKPEMPVFQKIRMERKKQMVYEHHYLRLLIQFHQRLVQFESKMLRLFNTSMFLTICLNSTCLCFCLYQLTVGTGSLSYLRLYKFVAELTAVALEYYYLCHCSEFLDDCHIKVQRAIGNSSWYRCSRSTQRDIRFFLRRVQKRNHLRFNQGAIVLSRPFFLRVVKLSYSFVNMLRLGTKDLRR